jgi:predicted RNA-binding protein with RPS1 domain
MLKTHVVVDGSNIATEGRTAPSLTQLDEAVRAFLQEHPSEQATVIVDATFGHRIHESERDAFEAAVDAGELLTAPAGTIGRGDAFILEVADKADATVLSNDSFQEFHGKFAWLFDEGRLVGGKPVPGVGWIFLLRSPVRGPVSRRAVQEAKGAKGARGSRGSKGDKVAKKRSSPSRPSKARTSPKDERSAKAAVARAAADDGSGARKRARQPFEPLNAALPFIEFVGAHPVGSTITGEVERFSSHGAYVAAAGARCYVPLKLMGDPPPKSAKEILRVGESRDFVVFAIDPPRRGIDLALTSARVSSQSLLDMPADQQEQDGSTSKRTRSRSGARRARVERDDASTSKLIADAKRAIRAEAAKTPTDASTLATNTRADQRAEEAPVTPARKKKAAAKRTAKKSAKRAPARKKKAPAKKRATKKRATKKRATKKAPAKKRATKKRATKKRAAKKRATKKRAAKKRATKKRATKKRATKKRATKKRATKKRAAKRPAKKRATKKRATKRRARRR